MPEIKVMYHILSWPLHDVMVEGITSAKSIFKGVCDYM